MVQQLKKHWLQSTVVPVPEDLMHLLVSSDTRCDYGAQTYMQAEYI